MTDIANLDTSIPVATRKGRQSPPYFHANWEAINTWGTTDHDGDGHHTVITLTPQADQSGTTDQGKLYGKDVSGKMELFYTDEDGNDIQLTSAGLVKTDIPVGTKMWFYANTAPTGWTYESSLTDKVLAIKGGSNAYNVSGGSTGGTWTQPNHTLTISEMPAHTHDLHADEWSVGGAGHITFFSGANYGNGDVAGYAKSTGGGAAHNHGTTYRPAAAVGIICSKDA